MTHRFSWSWSYPNACRQQPCYSLQMDVVNVSRSAFALWLSVVAGCHTCLETTAVLRIVCSFQMSITVRSYLGGIKVVGLTQLCDIVHVLRCCSCPCCPCYWMLSVHLGVASYTYTVTIYIHAKAESAHVRVLIRHCVTLLPASTAIHPNYWCPLRCLKLSS